MSLYDHDRVQVFPVAVAAAAAAAAEPTHLLRTLVDRSLLLQITRFSLRRMPSNLCRVSAHLDVNKVHDR